MEVFRVRRFGVGVVVLGMVFATAPAAPAQSQATKSPDRTVTLVTGDQVVLHAGEAREVRPAPGRDGMRFSVQKAGGHLYVVPADALRAVASGQVDRRIFDLTTLTEFG